MPLDLQNPADLTRREERRDCVRTLLQSPLIPYEPATAEKLRLIRRHLAWLRDWFHQYPGWHLQVESEFARLEKTPHTNGDGSRGLRDDRSGVSFSPRRYVLFCLALAVLEKSDRQCILGDLAAEVERLGKGDPVLSEAGLDFDFTRRECRQDLVVVLRVLLKLGLLIRIHGNEDSYVQQKEEVLYTLRRPVLARMLSVRRGPSTLSETSYDQRLRLIQEDASPESDEARRRNLRTELYRRLLDSPVVYHADLSEQEQAYLRGQRTTLVRNIEEATGMVAEIREEGLAMVDPKRQLTDHPMPEQGTEGHAALLIAEELCQAFTQPETAADPWVPVSHLEQFLHVQGKKHSHRWRRDDREPAGQRQLLRQVLARLEALHLIRRVGESICPLPALARYRLEESDHD